MNKLFTPLTLREVTFRNRIGIALMCQYSSDDGFANSWHMVHLGSRAVGGAGLVMTEAAAISPEGRISSRDLGIWSEAHASALAPIVSFIEAQGARAGVQLAHSGRKGSVTVPWLGNIPVSEVDGGWRPIGPRAIRYGEKYSTPMEMTLNEISDVVDRFGEAASLANIAGFSFIECHMAHGYLLHSFLSPLSNTRDDAYGGRSGLPKRRAKTRSAPSATAAPLHSMLVTGSDCATAVQGCLRQKHGRRGTIDRSIPLGLNGRYVTS